MRVTFANTFTKAARRLPPDRQRKVLVTIDKFQREPRLPSLDFRHLKGTADYHVIDSTGGDRIILRRVEDDLYEAVDCGTHDIYRRWDR